MPRSSTVVTIFMASPGDLSSEREFVSKLVAEWNALNARGRRISYELLRWENSVSAGFGKDGQDVINTQLPDYDVFIGLFWGRLGTKTPRADSGSAEEYQNALLRFRNGEDIEIAFLFKDVPLPPSQIDADQLAKLKEFQGQVQKDGAFTKNFISDDALRLEINLLLDKAAKRFSPQAEHETGDIKPVTFNFNQSSASASLPEDDDDPGLFDIIEDFQTHSGEATRILNELNAQIGKMTEEVEEATGAFNDISSVRKIEIDEAKPLIHKVSKAMDVYSDFVQENSASYAENVSLMSEDIRRLVDVSSDFYTGQELDRVNLVDLRNNLEYMLNSASSGSRSFENMREAVRNLQRMTSGFNKSRKRFIINTDIVIDINKSMESIVEQSVEELNKLIGKYDLDGDDNIESR